MNNEYYIPNVVDLAHEVIDMHQENIMLRQEVAHYKKMYETYRGVANDSEKHNNEMICTIFEAVIDPKSVISMGHAAINKEKMKVQ